MFKEPIWCVFYWKESRRHLSRLESLGGLGSLVKDISSLEERSERVDEVDKVGGLLFFIQQRSV
jgi:hypothetical protein